jgi:PAS domain S-box-containing protein
VNTDDVTSYTRQLLENAGDAVVIADRQGKIVFWNTGAASMFGHSSDEATGHSLDLIIPDRLRERHWVGYLETMRTGVTSYGERLLAVPGLRKDGSTISIEFRVTLLYSEDGESPSAIAAIIRDVTERWKDTKALRERLGVLEALAHDFTPASTKT